jgi:hypothetical protein
MSPETGSQRSLQQESCLAPMEMTEADACRKIVLPG